MFASSIGIGSPPTRCGSSDFFAEFRAFSWAKASIVLHDSGKRDKVIEDDLSISLSQKTSIFHHLKKSG